MNAPTSFIGSLFFDSKANAYSMSRMVMFGGFVIALLIGFVSVYIVYDSYRHGKAIPDLSWLLYGGTGSGAGGVIAYGMNKWGSKNDPLVPDEPEDEPVIPDEETANEKS